MNEIALKLIQLGSKITLSQQVFASYFRHIHNNVPFVIEFASLYCHTAPKHH